MANIYKDKLTFDGLVVVVAAPECDSIHASSLHKCRLALAFSSLQVCLFPLKLSALPPHISTSTKKDL